MGTLIVLTRSLALGALIVLTRSLALGALIVLTRSLALGALIGGACEGTAAASVTEIWRYSGRYFSVRRALMRPGSEEGSWVKPSFFVSVNMAWLSARICPKMAPMPRFLQ